MLLCACFDVEVGVEYNRKVRVEDELKRFINYAT